MVMSSPQLLPQQLESVPVHNSATASSTAAMPLHQNYDRKRKSGSDFLIESNMQVSNGLLAGYGHQRKPTLDLNVNKSQKGQLNQYQG